MTKISLELYPALKLFINGNKPATEVCDNIKYLTTFQILTICNDITFDEDLTEKIVHQLMLACGFETIEMGNGIICWALISKENGKVAFE